MNLRKATSWRAGVLYLLTGITGPFSLIYFPNAFIPSGDAAATARKAFGELLMMIWLLKGAKEPWATTSLQGNV